MTPTAIRQLADHHDATASARFEAARLLGNCVYADSCMQAHGRHQRWAAELRALAALLEHGELMGAKVIEAGEHDRRELVERIAILTRALQLAQDCLHALKNHNAAVQAAVENCLGETGQREIENALEGASA
jgi:hypothetical protein